MSKIQVSVSDRGYVVSVDSTVIKSKESTGEFNDRRIGILTSLEPALTLAKAKCDHGTLVVQLDSKYVVDHLQDDTDKPRSFEAQLMRCSKIIEECDAKVLLTNVDKGKTNADRFFKSTVEDKGTVEVLSLDAAFEF